MRNLSLFRNFSGRHRDLASFCDCIMFCDSATWKNTFLCTANDSGIIHIFDTDLDEKFNVACVIDLKEIESIEWLDTTSVVKLQQVFSTLYVMLNSGIFIVVPLPYTCRKELRIIDSGLDCVCQVSWSRDCERTVVIDEASFVSVICVVNDECEKLMGFSLQDVEEEENKLVNLGWGSVETQFRGSEVSSFETERKTRIACMDDTVEIVWKNNSSIFAINYMCRREGTRKLKIFDQNGVLLNIAKDIYGLSAAVDWCCSKNLIFMVQKLKDKTVACFLEENGLRHGEFRLPDDFIVKNLLWNSDGTILATMGMLSRSNRTHVVFLWTTSNYRWYAKYKLTFEKRVLHLQWDDVTPNRLHLILDSGVYRMFEWFFDTTESTEFLTNGQDSKFVVSVDGATVGFTRYGGLFPPISVSECACKFPSSINAFVFAANALRPAAAKAMAVVDRVSTACENDMFAESLSVSALLYLSDNSIFLCDTFQRLTEPREKMDVNGKRSFRLVLPRMRNGNDYKLIRFETAAEITAWLWLAECKRVYFCWTRLDGYYFCVCDFCFASARCVVRKSVKVDSRILITKNYGREVIVYLESGAVLVYKDDKLYSSSLILKEPCFRVEIANSKTMIALSVNRNLYVNEQIKWRDIRSFRWRRPFLVAVTSSHRLVIAKVKKNKFCDILSRLIEPKSHLVTIVGDRVLLEADRGNLELITPRPFVSFKMTLELLRRNYLNVFKLLKKQRVNLNVVFDHDPNAFTKNAALICETLTVDPSYLTLFVMELENSNVACRVFPWKYRERSEHHRRDYEDDDDEDDDGGGVVFVNKVGVVCDVLFAALKAAQSPNLILPTIAVLVRLGRLAEAAKYACENGEISFLFQLTDSRLVYEATLASYDLSCALKIAEFSKMDPCDYLPFIQKLQTLSKTMMRFTVNDRLGKTTKALKYLSASEEDVHFEECLRYVEKYRLYAEAFEIFAEHLKLAELRDGDQTTRKIHTRYMRIASSFGQHLLREKCFEDAAVVFEKARMYEKALECHSSSGNWHAAVSLIQSMHLNESMSTEWYRRLHTSLISKQRYEEAALVAFLLMKNASLATENYLLAHRYTKAVESANSFGSIPLILPSLKCSLLDETKTYSKEFHTRTTLLKRYTQRLKRINDEMNSRQDTIVSEEIDRFSYGESYASSESASSRSSTSTRLSSSSGSVSAKKLRRRERRLWNLKPGNPREKHSLMNAIRELIHDSDAKFSHAVPELTNALLHLEEYNVARNLHAEFVTYSQFVQRIISNLWKADSLDEEGGFLDISLKCPPLWSTYPNKSKLLNIDPIL